MDKIAVFVDAGYLFAQGSALLGGGSKKRRTEVALSPKAAIEELTAFAQTRAEKCRLLRIYWYDGTLAGSQPTSEQSVIADMDNVKLRLGFINNHGQQKGVDSLIVTDLIELSRLMAISDAIVLAGDEDLRVGVQIAQNYGVRVHLLGIFPSRGSQSRQLMREADTTSEWDKLTIEKFLSLRNSTEKMNSHREATAISDMLLEPGPVKQSDAVDASSEQLIEAEIIGFVAELGHADILGIVSFWKDRVGAPSDLDRIMLVKSRQALGRELTRQEIRFMRNVFKTEARKRIDTLPGK